MRFMAAQFEAYLRHDGAEKPLWYRNASHSNAMARLLENEIRDVEGVKIMYKVQVNSVFAQLPRTVWTALQQEYFFYDWDEAADVVRWMCSFDTTEEDIHAFVSALRRILKNGK
jgi:threonine aldolase